MRSDLAIDGGSPVRSTPVPGWPAPGPAAQAAVADVLASGRLNYWTGTEGRSLETEYAVLLGRTHGVAVTNGTLALELALRAFGIGPGNEVVVPARTFIATASAVVAVGATPIVADVLRDSGNIDPADAHARITGNTRAIIPVHVGGWPADVPALASLAREHDLVVIEDCAQANGAHLGGRPVGTLGSDAAAFSFCQDKIVPAGEGGLLLLDDDAAFERAWSYKDHGKSREKLETPAPAGTSAFRWVHDSFGSNWRLSEMGAALARAGLVELPAWHEARTRNALRLAAGLADVRGLRVPLPEPGTVHAFYRLYAYVMPDALAEGWDRDAITRAVSAEGVPVQYGTCAEIYREEAFAGLIGRARGERLPVASEIHETQLAFFVHPTLGDAEIDDTIAAVRKVMEVAAP